LGASTHRLLYSPSLVVRRAKAHIVKLLELMTPHAQKNWLKTMRGLMAYAVSKEMIAADPTEGVTPTKAPKSNGHMTWREPQIERFRGYYPLGTMARLALELMLNIAARRYDAHVLGHQLSVTKARDRNSASGRIKHCAPPTSCSRSASCRSFRRRSMRCRLPTTS
jgi:hypothetical protein